MFSWCIHKLQPTYACQCITLFGVSDVTEERVLAQAWDIWLLLPLVLVCQPAAWLPVLPKHHADS